MTVTTSPDDSSNTLPHEESDQSINQPLLNDDSGKSPRIVNSDSSETKCNENDGVEESSTLLEKSNQTPDILEGQLHREPEANEDDAASATMVVPPDGGWGWVVVLGSFFCNFFVDGNILCFGKLLKPIMDEFKATEPEVTVVSSLMAGVYLIIGPFVSALANRYGFRLVTVVGAFLAALGFGLCYVAQTLSFLYFSYGIVGGLGFGLIYAPSIITVGFYFEKWRALATGIAVCGSGIGAFLLGPLYELLIEWYGWQTALLVQACLILIFCSASGALFRPLKPVRVALTKEEEYKKEEEFVKPANNLLHKIKMARDEDLRKSESVTSLKNANFPTAAEILHVTERPDSAATVTTKLSKSTQSLNLKNIIIGHNENLTNEQKRLSAPNMNHINTHLLNQKQDSKKSFASQGEDVGTPRMSHKKRNRTASEASSTGTMGNRSRRGTVTECMIRSRRGTITQLDDNVNRPMYRDDIFFSASLHRLPQYKSERDFMGYTLSVTRLPTKKDLEEEEEFHCCPEAVRRTMATMLDVSLLKSPSFILLCISGFLTLMGFFTPFLFVKDRALVYKMDNSTASWLLESIGVTNTLGRVACGILTSFPGVNALLLNNIALTVGGIATIASGLNFTAAYQFSYCGIFGLSIAFFASLRSILIVDLLGLEKLTNAFGILLLFQGMAAAVGPPLASQVKDLIGDENGAFYFSGILILMSGVLCYPLNVINQWEKKKRKEAENENSRVV